MWKADGLAVMNLRLIQSHNHYSTARGSISQNKSRPIYTGLWRRMNNKSNWHICLRKSLLKSLNIAWASYFSAWVLCQLLLTIQIMYNELFNQPSILIGIYLTISEKTWPILTNNLVPLNLSCMNDIWIVPLCIQFYIWMVSICISFYLTF